MTRYISDVKVGKLDQKRRRLKILISHKKIISEHYFGLAGQSIPSITQNQNIIVVENHTFPFGGRMDSGKAFKKLFFINNHGVAGPESQRRQERFAWLEYIYIFQPGKIN